MYQLRKTIAIAVIASTSAFIPTAAYSLGIGEMKLHSGFNQNLKAEIELTGAADDKISDLSVTLATPEKFDEAGIPWSYFLKNIKFKPVRRSNGSTFIEISSNEALKELFLSFVLEVSWNKSDVLYREFTVLVEPSTTYNAPAAATTRHAKHRSEENFADDVASDNSQQEQGNQSEYFIRERAVRKKSVRADKTHYGPTKRTDFIWKVAKKTRPKGASVEQMIMALFQENPSAFYADNINALTVKKKLKIPEKETVFAMSRADALTAVSQQNVAWKEHVSAKAQGLTDDISNSKANLQLEASKTTPNTPSTPLPHSVAINEIDDGRSNKDKQSSTITSAEGLALLAKLEQLEQKLDMIQNKFGGANAANTAAQSSPPTTEASTVDSDTESTPPVSSSEGLALLAKQNEIERKMDLIQKMPAPTAANAPVAALPEEKTPPSAVKVNPNLNLSSMTASIKQPKYHQPVIKNTASPKPVPATSENSSMSLALYGVAGGLFFGILGCFWWLRTQRNKAMAEIAEIDAKGEYSTFSLSIPGIDSFFAKSPIDLNVDTMMVKHSMELADELMIERDTGFLNDDNHDAFDSASETIHPDVEAEMYLTYGYYDKAESLMRQAIENQPKNDEFKLKLLSIFHASKNKPAFELYMQELIEIGKYNNPVFWDSVITMAIEFEIENPSISQTARLDETEQVFNNTETAEDDESVFDLSVFEIESSANKKARISRNTKQKEASAQFVTLDKNSVETVANTESEMTDNQELETDELENHEASFELPDFIDEPEKIPTQQAKTINNLENEIAFDLSSFKESEAENIANKNNQVIDNSENEIVFDLSDLENSELDNIKNSNSQYINNSGNEIAFDLSSFDESEAESIANKNNQVMDNSENEIAFDLSDFDINEIEATDNQNLSLNKDSDIDWADEIQVVDDNNETSTDLAHFYDNPIENTDNTHDIDNRDSEIDWSDEIEVVDDNEVSFDLSAFDIESLNAEDEITDNKNTDIYWSHETQTISDKEDTFDFSGLDNNEPESIGAAQVIVSNESAVETVSHDEAMFDLSDFDIETVDMRAENAAKKKLILNWRNDDI
jgi:pilus assembly protein FimV